MFGSTPRKTTHHLCVILYAMYPPPKRTLTNLCVRLEQIGFVLKRTLPQGGQGVTCK